MAEIEHFVDPDGGKAHPRFNEVKYIELALLNRDVQLEGKTDVQKMSIGKSMDTQTRRNAKKVWKTILERCTTRFNLHWTGPRFSALLISISFLLLRRTIHAQFNCFLLPIRHR